MNSSISVAVASPQPFHVFDLARELHDRHALHRLYTAYPKWAVKGIDKKSIRTHRVLGVTTRGLSRLRLQDTRERLAPRFARAFDRWLMKHLEPCDVLHCMSSFGLAAHEVARDRWGALTVCDRGSTHILFQESVLAEEHERWNIPYKGIPVETIERELGEYETCARILVPSSFALASFREQGVAESKLRQVPYGVDTSLFHPPRADSTGGSFQAVFVGQVGLRKGVPYLLEAIRGIQPSARPELLLIGPITSTIRPLLERYEGLFEAVGPVQRAELQAHYGRASVLVFPSLEEGMALVLAQALACGVPVIATPNSGAEDLISDGVEGFIVPPRDPDAIRERVVMLQENPDLREAMGRAALKRANVLQGWKHYGQAILDAYDKQPTGGE